MKDHILILRYSTLESLPTALSQTEILHEAGLSPFAFEFGVDDQASYVFPHRRLPMRWQQWIPRPARALVIWFAALFYLSVFFAKKGRPRLVISHGLQESLLAYCLKLLWETPYVADVHEVYGREEMRGTNGLFFFLERHALQGAEWLLFPERNRLRLYQSRYGLRQSTYTIFNCPRPQTHATAASSPRDRLGIPKEAAVLIYMGGIGPHCFLGEAIAGLRYQARLHLLLVGWAEASFLQQLKQLGEVFGVSGRVHFHGPSRARWELLRAADVSYCLYKGDILRLRLASTASNKLMESLAAGVPVLSLKTDGFERIVARNDVGRCLERPDPRAIADAACALALAPEAKERSLRAKALHRDRLNYDLQFQPLLSKLQTPIVPSTYR